MVKEELDFGATIFGTIRFNLKVMEFGKRYTREKKDKNGRFYFNNYEFCVKSGVIFFKPKTSFLTELIFAKNNSRNFLF